MEEQDFEQFFFRNEEKEAQIRAIIDRHVRNFYTEVENVDEEDDGEWKNFDIRNYLKRS